jgi:hypothetical protein
MFHLTKESPAMTALHTTLALEGPLASSADLDRDITALLGRANLTPVTNRFFRAAKARATVDGYPALCVAHYWRELTKTFMFTTIAGLGGMAREAALHAAPPRHFLAVVQTVHRVIGDDLNNVMPVFQAAAPQGVGGIHYVWWDDTVLRPVADRLGLGPDDPLPPLPANVRALQENMHRLSTSALGTAVMLRVVEGIALDMCVAFKRVFSRVVIDGSRVFPAAHQLAWMNSHIQAEVAHSQQVSDHDSGMTGIADTTAKQLEMLRLTDEHTRLWNAALEDFAAALG